MHFFFKIRYGCVINVSSGDGELAYLHSVAAKRLRAMRSLEVRLSIYTLYTVAANDDGLSTHIHYKI
jgi:hypothetical protein